MSWYCLSNTPNAVLAPCAAERAIPALQLGLAVYTTLRWPAPEPWFKRHWQRLHHHAQAFGLASAQEIFSEDAIYQSLNAQNLAPCVLRLTLAPALTDVTSFLDASTVLPLLLGVQTRPLPKLTLSPLKLQALAYNRPWPYLKHTSIGPELLHKKSALAKGFDDVVWQNAQGALTEASTSALLALMPEKTVLCAPTQDALDSLSARWLMQTLNQQHQWQICSAPLTLARLQQAEGLVLCNCAQGFRAVSSIVLDSAATPALKLLTPAWPHPLASQLTHWQNAYLNETAPCTI
ncbi:MAG: aminotransferase class IV [Vampirovibrionales bacterium]|nr:aminotransferase class IV [Vampirovibrionales bacterium]